MTTYKISNNANLTKTTINNTNLRNLFDNIDFDNFDNFDNVEDYDKLTQSNSIKEKSTEKKLYCQNCKNSDNIIEDFSNGIIVCTYCGQVIDNILDSNPEWRSFEDDNKQNTNRCGSGVSKLLPQSSLGTTISGAYKSRLKTLHSWSVMPYRERSLHLVFKDLQEKCSSMTILKCIEDDAKIMYKAISECKHKEGKNKDKNIIIRGKNRKSLLAACIFYACRRKRVIRNASEIAEIFNIDATDITRGCKNFHKLINTGNITIDTGASLAEDFVARYSKDLGIKDKYIQQTIQLAKNIKNMNIASTHTPLSLAISSILLMASHNNIKEIDKKILSKKFDVSEVTITKTYNKIIKYKNILFDDTKVQHYINKQKNKQINHVIPNTVLLRFKKFNIPTDKKVLNNFHYDYSDIFKNINTNDQIKTIIKNILSSKPLQLL
jgi:transcription initiation factor TFIIB